MTHTIGNQSGMSIGMDTGNQSGNQSGMDAGIQIGMDAVTFSVTPFRFTPTHSILSFNEYGDPFELPLQRTNCFDEKGRAEWVDEFGRFTYMTDHQMNVFLTEMIHIPI